MAKDDGRLATCGKCGGPIYMVLTQEFSEDILQPECWDCSEAYCDPNEEVIFDGEDFHKQKRMDTCG